MALLTIFPYARTYGRELQTVRILFTSDTRGKVIPCGT